jgi:hypothetical protein
MRGFATLWFVALTVIAVSAAHADGLIRIDRSSAQESGELDGASQQAIARITGFGNFLVRTAKIHSEVMPLGHARVFFVYNSPDALRSDHALVRIFSSGDNSTAELAGDSEQLIGKLLDQIPNEHERVEGEKISSRMPEIVCAAVYANQAELLHSVSAKWEERGIGKQVESDPGHQIELREFLRDPVLRREADGGFVWEGRYLLRCGSVEEVKLTFSSNREHAVKLKRRELAPCNYFRKSGDEIAEAEEWVVSNESTWRPSRRLSFTLTLASLGNTKAKYQLGLALMQEQDESAKVEGIKWLRSAAADGYRDAVASVALFDADSRSPHDRESVRKDSCCRLPR